MSKDNPSSNKPKPIPAPQPSPTSPPSDSAPSAEFVLLKYKVEQLTKLLTWAGLALMAYLGAHHFIFLPNAAKRALNDSSVAVMTSAISNAHHEVANTLLPRLRKTEDEVINTVVPNIRKNEQIALRGIRSGKVEFAEERKDFESEKRGNTPYLVAKKKVTFDPPFESTPAVVVSFSAFNFHGISGKFGDTKTSLKCTQITEKGCVIELATWDDSKLWTATVNWIAHRRD